MGSRGGTGKMRRKGGTARPAGRWLPLALMGLSLAALALAVAPPSLAADTAPPLLVSAAPAEGQFFNAHAREPGGLATVALAAEVEDNDSALAAGNVTASVIDERSGDVVAPVTMAVVNLAPNTVQVNGSVALGEGAFRLVVDATDDALNRAHFERNFAVDFTPPSLEVFAPQVAEASTVTVRVDVRDAVSGVALPLFLSYKSACSTQWQHVPFALTQLAGRAVGEASFVACVGADNEYSVAAADRAGNAAATVSGRVAYDVAPPAFREFSPGPFQRLDGPRVQVSVWVTDDATGVNGSTVQFQYSNDGGVTWGNWTAARATASGVSVSAIATLAPDDGATVALRWRASDLAGNGPAVSRVQYFYVNGAPFLTALEPPEGAEILQYQAVRLTADFADPDADTVDATFISDRDGVLGAAGGEVQLSVGVHNLTVVGDDHHGHRVTYAYQVEVKARPPPDLRPLYFTGVLAGAMVWAAYAAWTREERDEGTGEGEGGAPPEEGGAEGGAERGAAGSAPGSAEGHVEGHVEGAPAGPPAPKA